MPWQACMSAIVWLGASSRCGGVRAISSQDTSATRVEVRCRRSHARLPAARSVCPQFRRSRTAKTRRPIPNRRMGPQRSPLRREVAVTHAVRSRVAIAMPAMVADRVAAQTRCETSHLSRRTILPSAVICKKTTKPISDVTNSSRSDEYNATSQAKQDIAALRDRQRHRIARNTPNALAREIATSRALDPARPLILCYRTYLAEVTAGGLRAVTQKPSIGIGRKN
jgi:hypothetical protein